MRKGLIYKEILAERGGFEPPRTPAVIGFAGRGCGIAAILVCALLSACGGGGSDSGSADPHDKLIAPVPLRPCETTGPTAPACSASQAAGTH
jgi:hypothetical protein